MPTIQKLPVARAVRREVDILHRVRRYEVGLAAVLAARPPELHEEPITDAEHLLAAQFVEAVGAYEGALRPPLMPDKAPPAPAAASAPPAKGRRGPRAKGRGKAPPAAPPG